MTQKEYSGQSLPSPCATKHSESRRIEFELFLEAIYRFCGYDLRQYSPASLTRLVETLARKEGKAHISELIPMLSHDHDFQQRLMDHLTVNYSALFRDPILFLQLKEKIFPRLESFPRLSIWVPGCASGEEVYSLLIALHEADLLKRSHIYATDISQRALSQAASGVVQCSIDQDSIERYNASGGEAELSDYFITDYVGDGHPKLRPELLAHASFKHHNLAQQPGFISSQLVVCRNVFIYFNRALQGSVLALLANSLVDGGYLAIGLEESINFCSERDQFDITSQQANIYRKKHQLASSRNHALDSLIL